MDENKKIVNYIIIGALVALFAFSIFMINKENNKVELSSEYQELKNYKVNEYIPTYVSDNDMAKIYLNDFITKVISEPIESYNLLDDEYKNVRYPNYDLYYNDFVINANFEQIKEFYKEFKNEYIIFGVYTESGKTYIFKTNGVMQYSVYLDDYTVEIG